MRKKPFFSFGLVFLLFSSLFSLTILAEEAPFIWPIQGKVITPYKDNGAYVAGSHQGIDIEAAVGNQIVVAADGTVHAKGKTPRGEPYVSVQHEGGLRTTYIPVEATVKKGQAVKEGEVLGTISSVGEYSSLLPHLHFGVKKEPYGSLDYLDPLSLLPPLSLKSEDEGNSGEIPLPATSPVNEVTVPEATASLEDPVSLPSDKIPAPQPSEGAAPAIIPTESKNSPFLPPLVVEDLPEPPPLPSPEVSPEPVLEASPTPLLKTAVEPLQSQQEVSVPPSSPAKKAVLSPPKDFKPASSLSFPWKKYLVFFSLSLVGALFYLRQRFFHLNLFRPFAKVLKGLL